MNFSVQKNGVSIGMHVVKYFMAGGHSLLEILWFILRVSNVQQ